jgi:hypothetical protein
MRDAGMQVLPLIAQPGEPLTHNSGHRIIGKRRENAERQTSIGSRRINLRARPGQHLQPNAAGAQVFDRVDQVAQVAAEPIEFPQHARARLK